MDFIFENIFFETTQYLVERVCHINDGPFDIKVISNFKYFEQCRHTVATSGPSKMKNLISLIAGSGILMLASAAVPYSHSYSFKRFKPQSCRSYTLDRCEFSADILHTTTLDVDDVFCQTLCDLLYGDECKYFVYDYPQRQCDIYGTKHDPTFKSLCAEHGGPVLPTIGHCEANDDPCIVSILLFVKMFSLGCSFCLYSQDFKYANCNYRAQPIKTYTASTDEKSCQLLCEMDPESCVYYLYEKGEPESVCKLFADQERTCDLLIGASQPSLAECAMPDLH